MDLADTLKMFVKYTENCLEAFQKIFSSKDEEELKLKIGLKYSDKTSFFEVKLFFFFQRHPETFPCTLRTSPRYLQGPHDLDLCVIKNIWTANHVNKRTSTKKDA